MPQVFAQRWSRALELYQAGQLAAAHDVCQELLADEPGHIDTLYLAGLCCRKLGRNDEAIALYQRAIEACNSPPALYFFELGIALRQADRILESYQAYRQAAELKPEMQEAYVNAGASLDDLNRHEEALTWYRTALKLKPHCVSTHVNLGNAYQSLGQFEAAIEHYHQATALDPQCAKAHWNCSMACLRDGRFAEGWDEYEWRERAEETRLDLYPQPVWDGSPLAGRTLLIHGEQGIGDEVLFASCFPDLIAQAAHCILVCEPRLERLFARSFPEATVVGFRRRRDRAGVEVDRPVDFQIAAGSVPRLVRRSLKDFPDRSHFLIADQGLIADWRQRLAQLGTGLKIGISWRAGGKPSEQFKRTTELELWKDLFALPGTHFVNLQYGQTEEDLAYARQQLGVTIHDWPDADPLTNLDGLAAQLRALDLIIGVGNTTIHLAGAVGAEAWALVPIAPSWRWMSHGESVPWYRSVRLFRQARHEGWPVVFRRVLTALCQKMGREVPPEQVPALTAPCRDDAKLDDKTIGSPGLGSANSEDAGMADAGPQAICPAQESGMKFVAKLTEQMDEAVRRHQAGDIAFAQKVYRQVLRNTPQHPDALHLLGLAHLQQGRPEQALRLIRQAMALVDNMPQMHYHLGQVLRTLGQLDDAASAYRSAIELDGNLVEARVNLGSVYQQTGQFDAALAQYQHAAALQPDSAGIHFNLGGLLHRLQRVDEAALHLERAVQVNPEFVEAHTLLGHLRQAEGDLESAQHCFALATQLQPTYAPAHQALGKLFQRLGHYDSALLSLQVALELKPEASDLHEAIGRIYQDQEQLTLAESHYRQAIVLAPQELGARANLVTVLMHRAQVDEALELTQQIIERHPQLAEAHLQQAQLWLQTGAWNAGWNEYEWRWNCQGVSWRPQLGLSTWKGREVTAQSLVVHAEGRREDDLLFSTLLPEVIDQAADCTLICPPDLAPLWRSSFPAATVVPWEPGQSLPEFAIQPGAQQLALGSIAQSLRSRRDAFPSHPATLRSDPHLVAMWQRRLEQLGHGPLIGLSWQDAEKPNQGTLRRPDVDAWQALAKLSATFIDLTPRADFVEPGRPNNAATAEAMQPFVPSLPLHSIASKEELDDLENLAALVSALDAVVSVDHWLAHLSGALGQRTWVVLPPGWGWSWGLVGEAMPWYRAARPIRADRLHDWSGCLAQVEVQLEQLCRTIAGGTPAQDRPRADWPHDGLPAPRRRYVAQQWSTR